MALVRRYVAISGGMTCAHTQEQMLEFATTILELPDSVPGVVVEAGPPRQILSDPQHDRTKAFLSKIL